VLGLAVFKQLRILVIILFDSVPFTTKLPELKVIVVVEPEVVSRRYNLLLRESISEIVKGNIAERSLTLEIFSIFLSRINSGSLLVPEFRKAEFKFKDKISWDI
jgi:hypothetical protein